MSSKIVSIKRCVQALEAEIALIESGKADNLLHLYGSYVVPEEFLEVCAGLKFPSPIYSNEIPAQKPKHFSNSKSQFSKESDPLVSSTIKLKSDRPEHLPALLGESPFAQSVINSFSSSTTSVDSSVIFQAPIKIPESKMMGSIELSKKTDISLQPPLDPVVRIAVNPIASKTVETITIVDTTISKGIIEQSDNTTITVNLIDQISALPNNSDDQGLIVGISSATNQSVEDTKDEATSLHESHDDRDDGLESRRTTRHKKESSQLPSPNEAQDESHKRISRNFVKNKATVQQEQAAEQSRMQSKRKFSKIENEPKRSLRLAK